MDAPGFTKYSHELTVWKRIRSGEIDYTAEPFTSDQEIYCPDEIRFVNPGDKLGTGPLRAAQAMADQAQEYVEDSASIRAEGHGASYREPYG